jgi:lysophospholipase L1-like esterase
MKLPLLVAALLALLFTAPIQAQSATPKPAADPALAPLQDTPGLPRVLIIGDSVSIGYTLPVRELLQGKANVHRIPQNGSSTGVGLANLQRWLGEGKWDVIHFNFGLHDAKQLPEGNHHSDPATYEKNLRELVNRLQASGAKLVWATTTPVPDGGILTPIRRFDDVAIYNTIAQKVMTENHVAIDDLNTAIQPDLTKLQIPHDVHYTREGYQFLAARVAASIEAQLAKK